jgi:hypothetical protein
MRFEDYSGQTTGSSARVASVMTFVAESRHTTSFSLEASYEPHTPDWVDSGRDAFVDWRCQQSYWQRSGGSGPEDIVKPVESSGLANRPLSGG